MRLLRAATLVTPDPDVTAGLYQTWFDYRPVETGAITPALAAAWGTPAMAGRRYSVMMPASGTQVYLRFVEGRGPADYQPLRSFGWGAIEICIQNVMAVHEKMLASPFSVIGPPKALDGSPAIWPMQVQGPDGEIIFLTEIRDDEPHARLPRAATPIDCLFIAVLACKDMAATRNWFEKELELEGGPDFSLAYTMLSRVFGLAAAEKHKIAVLGHGPDAFLQLDQYPAGATQRSVTPGELPPGVAMVTMVAPAGVKPSHSFEKNHAGMIYAGGLSRVLRTPEGALIELVRSAP
jgi:hypothetical protein